MKQLILILILAACGGASTETTTPSQGTGEDNDAAMGKLAQANELFSVMSEVRIECDNQANLEDYLACLRQNIRLLSGAALESVEAFRRVPGESRDTQWSVASLAGQGRTFARMAEIVVAIPVPDVYPQALLEEGARMSDEARLAVREQVETSVRAVLETQSGPIRCMSVVNDVMALRVARSGQVDSSYSQESNRRLSALHDEEIDACVEQGRTGDETLEPYTAGELNLQR